MFQRNGATLKKLVTDEVFDDEAVMVNYLTYNPGIQHLELRKTNLDAPGLKEEVYEKVLYAQRDTLKELRVEDFWRKRGGKLYEKYLNHIVKCQLLESLSVGYIVSKKEIDGMDFSFPVRPLLYLRCIDFKNLVLMTE
jgi:hypothetical protein